MGMDIDMDTDMYTGTGTGMNTGTGMDTGIGMRHRYSDESLAINVFWAFLPQKIIMMLPVN